MPRAGAGNGSVEGGPASSAWCSRLPECAVFCYISFFSAGTDGNDAGWCDEAMTGRTIRDLVGRVMIDREFLADLVRDPEGMLAGYELTRIDGIMRRASS